MSTAAPHIQIDGLTISYPHPREATRFTAIDSLSLEVAQGTLVTIVGPSGCGKSSLLLAVAGLIAPAAGRILVSGLPVTGPGRDRAMVFQDFALLPWRTVLGNVRFGLEMHRFDGEDLTERARRFLDLVGLGAFAQHHPHQLSGGMRQRVGIARALAVNPAILLMDEPFGALDAQTREAMGDELLRIWERDRKTALFVTHSIDEAILLGDTVVVMGRNPGHVRETLQIDLPRPRTLELTDSPAFAVYRRGIRQHLADDRYSPASGGGV